MKVIICAYRRWALDVIPTIRKHHNVSDVELVTNNDELEKKLWSTLTNNETNDTIVLMIGWSTPPEKHIVDMGIPIFTEHPSTSDRYSPGSPLQNQVLDGVRYTKHRLVKVGFPELSLRQWSHEVDIDLTGNMDDILLSMTTTSKQLFNMFLDDYPNVAWKTWDEVPLEEQAARRTPEQSKVTREFLSRASAREIYDLFRCLEDPYPNAFFEDETGKVYFKRVEFKSK